MRRYHHAIRLCFTHFEHRFQDHDDELSRCEVIVYQDNLVHFWALRLRLRLGAGFGVEIAHVCQIFIRTL